MEDIPLNIKLNAKNLTYLLNTWLRLYFDPIYSKEINSLSKKIIHTLRTRIDGKAIFSFSHIEVLEEAFKSYENAKTDLESYINEYSDYDEEDDYRLSGYKQTVKSAYENVMATIKLF